jgi:hypothetical protein
MQGSRRSHVSRSAPSEISLRRRVIGRFVFVANLPTSPEVSRRSWCAGTDSLLCIYTADGGPGPRFRFFPWNQDYDRVESGDKSPDCHRIGGPRRYYRYARWEFRAPTRRLTGRTEGFTDANDRADRTRRTSGNCFRASRICSCRAGYCLATGEYLHQLSDDRHPRCNGPDHQVGRVSFAPLGGRAAALSRVRSNAQVEAARCVDRAAGPIARSDADWGLLARCRDPKRITSLRRPLCRTTWHRASAPHRACNTWYSEWPGRRRNNRKFRPRGFSSSRHA